MKDLGAWARIVRDAEDPAEAIDKLATDAKVRGVWPFIVLSSPPTRWTSDTMRGAVANHVEHVPSTDIGWPVTLALLIPPYPSEHGALLDLLALACRALQGPTSNAQQRLVCRAATLFLSHALAGEPVVSFEAANVLGAVLADALTFRSPQERASTVAAFRSLQKSLKNSDLANFMGERAVPTIDRAADRAADGLTEPDTFFRLLSAYFQDYAIDEPFQTTISHVVATLYAFAESQAPSPELLGSAAIRVRAQDPNKTSTTALGVVQAWTESIAAFCGCLFAQPVALVRGSVEVVVRFQAEAVEHDEAPLGLVEAADRIEAILSPGSEARVPGPLAQLFDLIVRHGLSVDVDARAPDGRVRTLTITREKVEQVSEDHSVRRKEPDVESIDVPQADDLEKVFRVAELLVAGHAITVEGLGLTAKRQIDYYRHAARILGLVEQFEGVTPAGQQMAALTGQPTERLSRAAFLFERSAVGRAWLDWANANRWQALDPVTAEQFLLERTKVGGSTRGRRAGTLRRWLAEFKVGEK